jgi:hypothetical protein
MAAIGRKISTENASSMVDFLLSRSLVAKLSRQSHRLFGAGMVWFWPLSSGAEKLRLRSHVPRMLLAAGFRSILARSQYGSARRRPKLS